MMYEEERLEAYKERFDAGDGTALLDCICRCFSDLNKAEVPEWCRRRFRETVMLAREHYYTSWDHAFGRLHPKGTNCEKKRERVDMGREIVSIMARRRRAGLGVDNEAFESTAEEIGNTSRATVSRIYYEWKEDWKKIPKNLRHFFSDDLKAALDGDFNAQ